MSLKKPASCTEATPFHGSGLAGEAFSQASEHNGKGDSLTILGASER